MSYNYDIVLTYNVVRVIMWYVRMYNYGTYDVVGKTYNIHTTSYAGHL